MTFQEGIVVALAWLNVLLGIGAHFAKDAGTAYLLSNTTKFTIPSGSYRLRIFAVGGGGGGCGGIKQGKGQGAESVVNIINIRGPKTVDVIVGQGGLGARGHNVKATSNGMQTRFGDYVKASGGRGCTNDALVRSLQTSKGIHLFRLSDISKGEDGMDSTLLASTAQGGESGYLINGTGPRGSRGESKYSASGGTGFGAGGGAGGAIYSGDSPKIFSGGRGAGGVLYIELVHSVCTKPVDVMIAVESRKISEDFDNQLDFVQGITREFQLSPNYTRVALIKYAREVQLEFGFNDFNDVKSFENGILATKNDLNASGFVQIADVYEIALITFYESYSIGPKRGQASKAFLLLTYGENLTQTDALDKLKEDMKKQGITIAVVVVGNDTNTSHVEELVENVNNLFIAHTTDTSTNFLSDTKPWIADIICQDPANVKPSPSFTVSNTSNLRFSTSSAKGFHQSTPRPRLSIVLSTTSTAGISSYPSTSPSSVVVLRSSLTKPAGTQKTVDELEKGNRLR